MMKSPAVAIGFALILTSFARGEDKVLSELFRISDAERFVFVEEVPIGDTGEFGYEELTLKGKVEGDLKAALESAARQESSPDGSYPFIGYLAKLMLLDSKGRPICSMSVVNWDRTVVFKGVDSSEGKNRIEEPRVVVRSDAISRWVYNHVKDHSPEQLKSAQENYRKVGKTLESLLFPEEAKNEQQ